VTAPGVSSDVILDAIVDDLAVGSSEGWMIRCADGLEVRVFADVCFYVGDYEQVSKTSKLMGSSANSPCSLCTYRLPGIPGCRYGLNGSSADISLARTSARTRSVCKAAATWTENTAEG